MRKFLLTAAALTLGTSALAWAPADKDMAGAKPAEAAWSDDKGAKSAAAWTGKTGSAMAAAALGVHEAAMAAWGDGMTSAALGEKGVEVADWSDVKVQTAALDVSGKPLATAEVDADWSGKPVAGAMGGPLEEAQGYPPCDPGPGDDRCIQLYERGVREALVQYKGLGDDQVAMGGPFEPAAEDGKPAAGEAMDHSAHMTAETDMSATVKPTADATADATVVKPVGTIETTVATTPGGVGGPIEERTGYPPCDPGPGDDRCIQLYERGVTGQGN